MAYHLAKIDWAIFGTASWMDDSATRYSEAAKQIRQRDFRQFIWHTCSRLKLRPRNLAIYGKTEWGADMRGHYNFLIGRQGTEKTTPEIMAAILQDFWSNQHGLCKIEPFDVNRQCEGVRYQSKQEYDASGNPLWHPEFISPALLALFRKNAAATPALILPPLPSRPDFTSSPSARGLNAEGSRGAGYGIGMLDDDGHEQQHGGGDLN